MFSDEGPGGPQPRSQPPLFNTGKPFYSLDEVCRITGKSEQAVTALVRSGDLREFRDGRKIFFKSDDLAQLFKNSDVTSSIKSLGEANSLFAQMTATLSGSRDHSDRLTELGAMCGAWVDKRNKGTTIDQLRNDIHLAARALGRLLSDDYSSRLLSVDIQRNETAGLGKRVDDLSRCVRLVTLSQINPREFLKDLPSYISNDKQPPMVAEVALEQTMHIGSPNIEGGPGSQALLRALQKICNQEYRIRYMSPEMRATLTALFQALHACSLTNGQRIEVNKFAVVFPKQITGEKPGQGDTSEGLLELNEDPKSRDRTTLDIEELYADAVRRIAPDPEDEISLLELDEELENADPLAVTPLFGIPNDEFNLDEVLGLEEEELPGASPPKRKVAPLASPEPDPPVHQPVFPEPKSCLLSTPPLLSQLEDRAMTEAPGQLLSTSVPEHFATNWATHFLLEHDSLSMVIEEVSNDANRKTSDSLRLVVAECNEAIEKLGNSGVAIGTFEVSKPSENGFELFSTLFTKAKEEFENVFKRLKDNQVDASALVPSEHQRWNNLLSRVESAWNQRSNSKSPALKALAASLLKDAFGELRDHIETAMLPTLKLLQEQLQLALETRVSRLLQKL